MIQTVAIWPPNAKTGSFVCPSSAGNYSVSSLLFKPNLVEFLASRSSGPALDFLLSHGFADKFGTQSAASWCTHSKGNTYGDFKTDRCIHLIDWNGVTLVRASFVSMNNNGFTVNFSVVNSQYTISWSVTG